MSEEQTVYEIDPPEDAADNEKWEVEGYPEMIAVLKAEIEGLIAQSEKLEKHATELKTELRATKQQLEQAQRLVVSYQNLVNGVKLLLVGATG